MIRLFFIIFFLFLINQSFSQSNGTERVRYVRLNLVDFKVKPLCIKGVQLGISSAPKEVNGGSFHILGTASSSINGFSVNPGVTNVQNMRGMVIGGLWSEFSSFKGLNFGGIIHLRADTLRGVSFAMISSSTNFSSGLTFGLVNRTRTFDGVQLGIVNVKYEKGYEYGVIKGVKKHSAYQVGIINYSDNIKVAQIGLVNYIKTNPPGLRLLPLFNKPMGIRKRKVK
jgi:hypothetical protein